MRTKRRRREGMTLVEIMVVVILMALIAAAVGVNVVQSMIHARVQDTRVRARTIQSAALQWTITNTGNACPTMHDVEPMLDATTDHRDAWEQPFEIRCEAGAIVVRSRGPDELANTEDDIGTERRHD